MNLLVEVCESSSFAGQFELLLFTQVAGSNCAIILCRTHPLQQQVYSMLKHFKKRGRG